MGGNPDGGLFGALPAGRGALARGGGMLATAMPNKWAYVNPLKTLSIRVGGNGVIHNADELDSVNN